MKSSKNFITEPEKWLPEWLSASELEGVVIRALNEDVGSGDVTSGWTMDPYVQASARIVAKDEGIIAGLLVARQVFKTMDPEIAFEARIDDGQPVTPGDEIASIQGSAQTLLAAERTALNFLQRMSGIATQTAFMTRAIKHTDCRILDTRKTAPGLRLLDKWSVLLGGGVNHRLGLFDMVLIKENHIRVAGGIRQAVNRVLQHRPHALEIEVEVQNLDELRQALEQPIHRILLDNMSLETLRAACDINQGRIPLEASGNVTLQNIASVAETGVDFISVGALTHSVRALDVSLLVNI